MMLSDRTHAKVGDVVRAEPPRGAAVVDCNGGRWFHYGAGWVQDPELPVPGTTWTWPLLRELNGPLRLSR